MLEWWCCGRCFVIEVVGVPSVAIGAAVFPTTRNPVLLWLPQRWYCYFHMWLVGTLIGIVKHAAQMVCKHAALIPASRKVKHVFSTVRVGDGEYARATIPAPVHDFMHHP